MRLTNNERTVHDLMNENGAEYRARENPSGLGWIVEVKVAKASWLDIAQCTESFLVLNQGIICSSPKSTAQAIAKALNKKEKVSK